MQQSFDRHSRLLSKVDTAGTVNVQTSRANVTENRNIEKFV